MVFLLDFLNSIYIDEVESQVLLKGTSNVCIFDKILEHDHNNLLELHIIGMSFKFRSN